jgi:antitoxin component YwqK of YwqJK toxin-antitoxin module
MKKTTIILIAMTVLLSSCSEKHDRVTVQETFANGQPKTTIYRTIDDKNTYYEIEYDSLGRIKEIVPYSDAKKNGTQVYFRENLDVGALLTNRNGKRQGFTYEFYEGLQTLFKGEANDGEFNGLSTWFHKNGKPEDTGIRTNGKKEGEWKEFYENGQLKSIGTYTNGVKNDDWIYYNLNGIIDSAKTK